MRVLLFFTDARALHNAKRALLQFYPTLQITQREKLTSDFNLSQFDIIFVDTTTHAVDNLDLCGDMLHDYVVHHGGIVVVALFTNYSDNQNLLGKFPLIHPLNHSDELLYPSTELHLDKFLDPQHMLLQRVVYFERCDSVCLVKSDAHPQAQVLATVNSIPLVAIRNCNRGTVIALNTALSGNPLKLHVQQSTKCDARQFLRNCIEFVKYGKVKIGSIARTAFVDVKFHLG